MWWWGCLVLGQYNMWWWWGCLVLGQYNMWWWWGYLVLVQYCMWCWCWCWCWSWCVTVTSTSWAPTCCPCWWRLPGWPQWALPPTTWSTTGRVARKRYVRVVLHQGGPSSVWCLIAVVHQSGLSFIGVVFYQGGLASEWYLIRVVSHLGGLSSVWSFIRVASHLLVHHGGLYQGGLSSGWFFHVGGLWSVWSVIRAVFHLAGPLSWWSLIRGFAVGRTQTIHVKAASQSKNIYPFTFHFGRKLILENVVLAFRCCNVTHFYHTPTPSSTSLSALSSSNGQPPDPFSLWSLVSASDGHDGGTELHRLAGGHGAHHGRRGSCHRHHLQVLRHLPLQQPPAYLPLLPGLLLEHHLDVVSGCFCCCCCCCCCWSA